jgi:CRAL/TRIO domain
MIILNAGWAFNGLFNLVKPFLSKRALGKIFVVGRDEAPRVLEEKMGIAHLETAYGGLVEEPDLKDPKVLAAYFDSGYWAHPPEFKGEEVSVCKDGV